MKKIMITREHSDAGVVASRLMIAAGISPVITPVLSIEPVLHRNAEITPENAHGGVIFTSPHAVRNFHPDNPDIFRKIRIFCVGEKTAAAAAESGFYNIAPPADTVHSLEQQILRSTSPEHGAILYVRGRDIAEDIAGHLRCRLYTVNECIVYQARRIKHMDPASVCALMSHDIFGVMIYSRRSSEAFAAMIRKEQSISLASVFAFVISRKAAAPVYHSGFREIIIPDTPSGEAMIESVIRRVSV